MAKNSEPTEDQLRALKNEIVMAEKMNEEELEPLLLNAIARYTGRHRPHFGNDWDVILNEVYPIVQQHLPAIFFRIPRAFLKPRNKTYIGRRFNPQTQKNEDVQLESQKSANTQGDILNYLITQIGYKEETRKTLLDSLLFPYGIMWHGYKGNFGMTEEQNMFIQDDQVFVQRINPMHFIHDPSYGIDNIHMGRWVGRTMHIPLRDITEDDKLNVSKELKGFDGFGNKVGTASTNTKNAGIQNPKDFVTVAHVSRPLIDFAHEDFKTSMDSRFVKVHEVFLLPSKKQKREGAKGWILLLTDEQDEPLRINEWTIKAEGFPSKILQFNQLPDAAFGLSDPETYSMIVDQKNIIVNQQIQNAKQTGKVWIGLSKDSSNEDEIQAVQNGQNTIVTFEADDVRKRMFVASAGGQASSELYLLDGRIQTSLDNQSGVTDLRRGVLRSGEESATSVKIRSQGQSARVAYRQDIMSDFLKLSLLYINQLNKQFMTIKDAVRIIGSLDLQWSENPSKEELQADVDVEIDVISMLPENPERELEEMTKVLALMIQSLNDPNVLAKLQEEGRKFNLSPVIEQTLRGLRINNPEVFESIDPDDNEGVLSVAETKKAKANVGAVMNNQQMPFPPTPNDDHRARLETYSTVSAMLQIQGQVSEALNQLIQVHQAFLADIQSKQAQPGQQVNLKKPSVTSV